MLYKKSGVTIVGDYVKGASILDVSASGVLDTHIPDKKIAGNGSPILDRMSLVNPGKKKCFSDILRS